MRISAAFVDDPLSIVLLAPTCCMNYYFDNYSCRSTYCVIPDYRNHNPGTGSSRIVYVRSAL